jgi:hypothetical protein
VIMLETEGYGDGGGASQHNLHYRHSHNTVTTLSKHYDSTVTTL